jgi:'chromo' (CHRromatin Organisation MOdifier) domain.
VHDVFHVSQLKKCLRVPSEQADSEQIEVREDLTYVEKPVKILDTMERRTRNRVIRFCKVQWTNHAEEEASWEREDELKAACHTLKIQKNINCCLNGISRIYFKSLQEKI